MGRWLASRTQPASLDPQLISDGVPLVLAMAPHRQLHSSMTQDVLVSALGRVPPAPPTL